MKKIGLLLSGLCMSVVFLTSCLKGNSIWEGDLYGVISFNGFRYLFVSSSGSFYSPNLEDIYINGQNCYKIHCKIDAGAPENSYRVVQANGYMKMTYINHERIPDFEISYSSQGNSSYMLANEVPISKVSEGYDYSSGYLFLKQLINIPDDWELNWIMNYDPATFTPSENSIYYNLYVRVTAISSEKTQNNSRTCYNAYNMRNMLSDAANNEKEKLGTAFNETSKITLKINYVSSVDETSNTVSWSYELVEIPLLFILMFEASY